MEITDDGRYDRVEDTVDAGSTTGSGNGIPGMRERVAALGGELDAAPRAEGGFRVWARLPLAAPAAQPSDQSVGDSADREH